MLAFGGISHPSQVRLGFWGTAQSLCSNLSAMRQTENNLLLEIRVLRSNALSASRSSEKLSSFIAQRFKENFSLNNTTLHEGTLE